MLGARDGAISTRKREKVRVFQVVGRKRGESTVSMIGTIIYDNETDAQVVCGVLNKAFRTEEFTVEPRECNRPEIER